MAENTFYVNLTPEQAAQMIETYIVQGSITGEAIDRYILKTPEGATCISAVFEKHYYRAGNRLTLSIVIDNFTGHTRVHTVGGGGGQGLFKFDWGASGSFVNAARQALQGYILQ